jgi:predicted nuclease with TOPRIM domain
MEELKSLESKLSDLETRWLELSEQLEGATGGPARASSNAEY